MGYSCRDIVWDYVRPSSSFINTGTYAPPSTPRVHAFAAVPRTEPADCETQPPVGGIGTDVCRGRRNPYRGGLGSFHLRFTYLREGGHQVSRSPGPGSYETRHLTGGALVKRPKTASPCFRRPGGRLQFEGGGAWHEETPLVSAERRGTVRGNVKAQPQHYSLSFRSKADRLVVNKPTGTTHEGLGPGCYDVSKDGKSVGVKTEKRVARSGCSGKGSTNQFLVDWRAYMKRPSKVHDGFGDCGCAGNDGTSAEQRGKAECSRPYNKPETPQTVLYTFKNQSDRWPAARKRTPAAAGRRRTSGGPGLRLREGGQAPPPRAVQPQPHRPPEEDQEGEEESFFPRQQPQHKGNPPTGREKRPASAAASLRIPSTTEPHATPTRCSGLPRRRTISAGGRRSGLGSGLGGGNGDCNGSFAALSSISSAGASGPPQFVPRPPSVVDIVSRPRTACSASSASRGVDNSAESCSRNDRRQSGGGTGTAEVSTPRASIDTPLSKPVAEEHPVYGVSYSPNEAVHRSTRPLQTTAKSLRSEKADVTAGSEQPLGIVEDGAPRGTSRPVLPSQPQPPVNSRVRSEDLREGENSSGNTNTATCVVASKPASGREGGELTARAEGAIPCSDVGHCSQKAAHTAADVDGESIAPATTTLSSSRPSPGASSGRHTPSPSSPRSRSDDSTRNISPRPLEPTDSCSPPDEGNKADSSRTSPQPFATRTSSSGTAVVAPTLTSASNPPGQAAPEPPPPKSNPEYDTRASSTREASSRPSTGRSGEAAISAAIWRIQAKGSFASVLDVVERRSTESSRVSSRSGLGSLSDDLDVRPRRTSPGVGVPWNSSVAGPRNNSEGYRFSAGLAEQHATPPRARYKSFQPRPDLSLVGEVVEEAAPERPRLDPSVASLVAATATQEICLGAMSLVAATRLSDVVAGGGTGAGRPLVSREQ